ncbi:MAG: sugar kinase [Acidobacteria bacterium]|nr:sugar kinase [Acidobacteriota bacterium]
MKANVGPKIVLIHRKTRLQELKARFNTIANAKFYVEHLGMSFDDFVHENDGYQEALQTAESHLSDHGRVHRLDRTFLPNFVFGPKDYVVVVGQDGLVANAMKYLSGQPIVGVNPDPKRWEGVLLPFKVDDLADLMPEVMERTRPIKRVSMAKVTLNTHQELVGVNDIFVGPRSHTSARYRITLADVSENHSSSGIIVSTGLGSTGWFRSVITGASGIAASFSGQPVKLPEQIAFPWDAPYLYFSVREPWPSQTSAATLTFGRVDNQSPLYLRSMMPQDGVIFSDGIESDFLEFNSGTEAVITLAEKSGALIV